MSFQDLEEPTSVIDYLPTYFQAVLLQSPIVSGISFFGNALVVAPVTVGELRSTVLDGIYADMPSFYAATGALVTLAGGYWWPNLGGWLALTVGVALLSMLSTASSNSAWICFQVVEGVGLGILYVTPQYPVLAALPVAATAPALTFYMFVQSLGQAFGVTIGATTLQNQLRSQLPPDSIVALPQGTDIAYAIIPTIKKMSEPLQLDIRAAFAASLHTLWYVMTGLSVIGLCCALGFERLALHSQTDKRWGLENEENAEKPGVTIV